MLIRHITLSFVSLFIFLAAHSQLSETFKSIDAKNSFKDVVFGSTYSQVSTKLGLTKRENQKNFSRYNITTPKYLSVGFYDIEIAYTEFSDGKLSMIVFEIPHNIKDVIEYFTTMFGKPKFEKMWLWSGKNITYVIGGDINTSNALVLISSNNINADNGNNNF